MIKDITLGLIVFAVVAGGGLFVINSTSQNNSIGNSNQPDSQVQQITLAVSGMT